MKLKNKLKKSRKVKKKVKFLKSIKNFLVCDECGSMNVQVQAWVDANTNKYIGCRDENDAWCDDCESHVRLTTLKDYLD